MNHFIIESDDGRVLRINQVGIYLGGSDPTLFSDEQAAKKVAETVVAILSTGRVTMKLSVRKETAP